MDININILSLPFSTLVLEKYMSLVKNYNICKKFNIYKYYKNGIKTFRT